MTTDRGPERRRFLDRLTEPIAERAREKLGQAEDKVRSSIQAEIDAVSASVRARAVQVRPSAIAFGAAALLTFFGLALFVTAAVMGMAHVVEPWLAALLVGTALLLVAAGFAAWGRSHLPRTPAPRLTALPEPTHPAEELVHPWDN
ncbi:phage holin family protein [Cellulomonas persica]|uniref:Phage holin family protein n=1 Tax=Cellulomonas persica TaxID=76861 RepID=A0A510UW70_9CELL|nr:phage holin family protein [Cellulomonas persica]GEK17340.1 hypothetical protein CPE01_10730 [Cellulomonas persica]